jgi:hypothetical protein
MRYLWVLWHQYGRGITRDTGRIRFADRPLPIFTAIRLASSRVGRLRSKPTAEDRYAGARALRFMSRRSDRVGAFSQVSVEFEQENPLSLDYTRRAVGPAQLPPMPVHCALLSVGEETDGRSL